MANLFNDVFPIGGIHIEFLGKHEHIDVFVTTDGDELVVCRNRRCDFTEEFRNEIDASFGDTHIVAWIQGGVDEAVTSNWVEGTRAFGKALNLARNNPRGIFESGSFDDRSEFEAAVAAAIHEARMSFETEESFRLWIEDTAARYEAEAKTLDDCLSDAIYYWSLDFYRSKTKYDVCVIHETEDAPSDYIRDKTFTDTVLAERYAEKLRKKLGTEVIVEVREGDTMEDNYLPISSVCEYENADEMHARIWF